jgi:hypothetical protein
VPQASERERERLALRTYRSHARDTIDFIRGLSLTRAEFEPMARKSRSYTTRLFCSASHERVCGEEVVAGAGCRQWRPPSMWWLHERQRRSPALRPASTLAMPFFFVVRS